MTHSFATWGPQLYPCLVSAHPMHAWAQRNGTVLATRSQSGTGYRDRRQPGRGTRCVTELTFQVAIHTWML